MYRFGAAPPGPVHPEVIRPGKGEVLGILKERVDQIGLLAAPDLVWNLPDPECISPDKAQPLLPVLLAVKLQFHSAPPGPAGVPGDRYPSCQAVAAGAGPRSERDPLAPERCYAGQA